MHGVPVRATEGTAGWCCAVQALATEGAEAMPVRFRPKAPKGTHWTEAGELVGDSGYLELRHETLLALDAQAALEEGASAVAGRVAVTFWVAVEEVSDGPSDP